LKARGRRLPRCFTAPASSLAFLFLEVEMDEVEMYQGSGFPEIIVCNETGRVYTRKSQPVLVEWSDTRWAAEYAYSDPHGKERVVWINEKV
jgi:hypothetical protein